MASTATPSILHLDITAIRSVSPRKSTQSIVQTNPFFRSRSKNSRKFSKSRCQSSPAATVLDFKFNTHIGHRSPYAFRNDAVVDKIWSQIGSINPIPSSRSNRIAAGFYAIVFVIGMLIDRVWNWRKRKGEVAESRHVLRVPVSFSTEFEKDMPRKETVEWVNMVVGKLWKVYREGIEGWVVGSMQPVMDDLERPGYVERVLIERFSLGDEALSVRSVERRTSREANDLQYHIGIRYTGDARMLLSLKLKCGILSCTVPVGIKDFDIDGELWVKLQLISREPWIGAMSWAFVSLPKIKFVLAPFRLFNVMGIPVLSIFLRKLLMEDVPQLFVRPNKIVVDFLKENSLGLIPDNHECMRDLEKNKDYIGELSVTLVDARNLTHLLFVKSDPYVVLTLGDQVLQSKKNSQTTIIGPPGEPIWNQDFHMLVRNSRDEKLKIQVRDSIGILQFTVGTAEISIGSLKDTVPVDKIVALRGSWTPLNNGFSGKVLLRVTYKAFVEDEDAELESVETSPESGRHNGKNWSDSSGKRKPFMDFLTTLLVSEDFRGKLASEAERSEISDDQINSNLTILKKPSPNTNAPPISAWKELKESPLIWIAAITSITILISAHMASPLFFNS